MRAIAQHAFIHGMGFPSFHQSCAPLDLGPKILKMQHLPNLPQCGHHASYGLHPVHLQDPLPWEGPQRPWQHGLDTSRLELTGSIVASSWLGGCARQQPGCWYTGCPINLVVHWSCLGKWVKKSGACKSWHCHCIELHKFSFSSNHQVCTLLILRIQFAHNYWS